jgi:hypothetical protein
MATSSNSPTAGESRAASTPTTSEAPATEAPATASADETNAALDAIFGQNSDGSRPALSELTGIKYVGSSDRRTLSAAELTTAGVKDPKGDLEWTPENGFTVPISEVNAATADLLYSDTEFELV